MRTEASARALGLDLLTLKSFIYLLTQQDDGCTVFCGVLCVFVCLALSWNVFNFKVPKSRGHAYLTNFPLFSNDDVGDLKASSFLLL